MGFDYDRWAGGQEDISYTMKLYTDPNNKYEVEITANKADLRIISKEIDEKYHWIAGMLVVPFIKEKGKWKMADNISVISN